MIDAEKAALRAAAKTMRATARRGDPSPAVAAAFADRPPRVVAGYVAIGDECDPAPALTALRARGARIALPRTTPGAPLDFRLWADGDPLEDGPYGTRQPGDAAARVRPDAVIAPLLAFDRRGGRLGYGGGFYDRTLAALRADGAVFALGLGFGAQEVDLVPVGPHDQRLDAVATDHELIIMETA